MELINYPQAIADASREFLAAEEQVRQLEKEVERLKLAIDSQVYFDPKLKNQQQRDCRRTEMLRDDEQYQAGLAQLEEARTKRNLARVHLRYLQNRFDALKLALLAKLEFLVRVQTPDDVRVHLAGLGLEGLLSSYGGARRTTPSDAADQILAFVEALTIRLGEGEPMSDEQWVQKMSTPEFIPEERGEFEDEAS